MAQKINIKITTYICRKRISRIVSISRSASDRLKKITGHTAFNIPTEVVYNGVDTAFFNTHLSAPYKKGVPQLLFVGHLYHHKNVIKLIDSMNQILKIYPKAHLQIVGDGEDLIKLSKIVALNQLDKSVDVLGNVSAEELRLRYSSCDTYISASLWEEFGLPPVEAMACGKPVLLSDIPAHNELVEASHAGLIFSLSDDSAIVDGIRKINESPEGYRRLARKFAESHDWTEVCKRISAIYHEVCS